MRYENTAFVKHAHFSLFISTKMYSTQCVTTIVTVLRDIINVNVMSRDMAPLNAPVNFSSLLGIPFHSQLGRK